MEAYDENVYKCGEETPPTLAGKVSCLNNYVSQFKEHITDIFMLIYLVYVNDYDNINRVHKYRFSIGDEYWSTKVDGDIAKFGTINTVFTGQN